MYSTTKIISCYLTIISLNYYTINQDQPGVDQQFNSYMIMIYRKKI
jgi:hypothetical protein